MKDFFEKNKKKIIEVIIIILALIALSFIALLLLESFGIVYYEDGVQLNSELFNKFKNSFCFLFYLKKILSIKDNSSGVKIVFLIALRLSSSCSFLEAPTSTIVTMPSRKIHASAICARV